MVFDQFSFGSPLLLSPVGISMLETELNLIFYSS